MFGVVMAGKTIKTFRRRPGQDEVLGKDAPEDRSRGKKSIRKDKADK